MGRDDGIGDVPHQWLSMITLAGARKSLVAVD